VIGDGDSRRRTWPGYLRTSASSSKMVHCAEACFVLPSKLEAGTSAAGFDRSEAEGDE
jgi:hypothetical protein